jgi:hypothetical protein
MVEGGSKNDTFSFLFFLKQTELCFIAKKKYNTNAQRAWTLILERRKYIFSYLETRVHE